MHRRGICLRNPGICDSAADWANFSERREPVGTSLRNFPRHSKSSCSCRDDEGGRNRPRKRWQLQAELNVLALFKGTDRYIFVYDDDSRAEIIDSIRDLAANPHMSLSWFDANVLTRKAREQEHVEGSPLEAPQSPWE